MSPSEPVEVTALRAKTDELSQLLDYKEWILSSAIMLKIDLSTSIIWTGEYGSILIEDNVLTWGFRPDFGPDIHVDISNIPTLVALFYVEMKRRIMTELNKTENFISFGAVKGPPENWNDYQILDLSGKEISQVVWADALQDMVCVHETNEAGKHVGEYVNGKPDLKRKVVPSRIVITKPNKGSFF